MVLKYLKIREMLDKAIAGNPDINQKTVAAEVGISEGYLSQILSGNREGSLDLLIGIAKAVGVEQLSDNGIHVSFSLSAAAGAENKEKDVPEQPPPSKEIAELLAQTRIVLESETRWSETLRPNIEAFYVGLMSNENNQRKSEQIDKIPETGDRRKKAG